VSIIRTPVIRLRCHLTRPHVLSDVSRAPRNGRRVRRSALRHLGRHVTRCRVAGRPNHGGCARLKQVSARLHRGSDPVASTSRLMVLLCWPFEPQDSRNVQHPGVGTSVMLGPPTIVTTGCDFPNG